MTAKEKYRLFCSQEKSIPTFSQDWWLDVVCGENNWNVAILENNEKVIAALPYQYKKRYCFNYIINPTLTPRLGIWIEYPKEISYVNKIGYEKKIIQALLKQLPKFHWFNQGIYQNLTNWLPFYWEDYKQTTKYTYTIENSANIEGLEKIYSNTAKRGIRLASENLTIKDEITSEESYFILNQTFNKQNIKNPFNFEILKSLIQKSYLNNCGKLIGAVDLKGTLYSVLFFVWNNEYLTLIFEGNNYMLGNSYAKYLLFDYAIKFGVKQKLKIDFEGSMLKSVEHVNRQFGAQQIPYFQIEKVNSRLLKTWFFLKDLI